MEIKVSTDNQRVPVTVMHVDGNIDSATYEAFQAKAEEIIQSGARHLLIDLSHSKFVSSAGLRALHAIFNKLNSLSGETFSESDVRKGIAAGTYKSPYLKLLKLSPETRTAFETGGFDMYIETFTDLKTAVASF